MTIKQIGITIVKKKDDKNPNVLDVIMMGIAKSWFGDFTKQRIAEKFNEHQIQHSETVEIDLLTDKNYILKVEDKKYKLYARPVSQKDYDLDFTLLMGTENADVKVLNLTIYYAAPNNLLDHIGRNLTTRVQYKLQPNCQLAIDENEESIKKIDEYLKSKSDRCLSSIWQEGIKNKATSGQENITPQQILITSLFNKL